MKILLSCAAVAVLAVIPTNVGAQEAGPIPINCAWSTTWSELKAAMPPAPTGAKITPPKKKRGSIDRPDSNVRRTITGAWTVELVIDDKGDVRDARLIQAPMIEPPWPEYDVAILKSVRSWKYSPLLLGNQPWPYCMTLTLRDRE